MKSGERIKLRHLTCLVALAEHGNFVRAADALALSQPAVTKTLQELEDIVGQPLVLRRRDGVALTPAGQVLVRHAGSSLRSIREGLDRIARPQGAELPVLMLGALPNVANGIVPAAIVAFEAQGGRCRFTVRTGSNAQLIAALRQGELDLVFGRMAESADMRGLSFEQLFSETLVFAVRPGHALARVRKPLPRQLLDYRLILPDEGTRIRQAADAYFVASGLAAPQDILQTIDVSFGRAYVLQSDAIWCAPEGVLQPDLEAGVLQRLALDTELTRGPVGLSVRTGEELADVLQGLMAALRAQVAT